MIAENEDNKLQTLNKNEQQARIRLVVYPLQIVQTDREIQEIQRQLNKTIQEIRRKQQQHINNKSNPSHQQQAFRCDCQIKYNQQYKQMFKQQWRRQQEMQTKNKSLLNKCIQFYESKLFEEKARHIEMRDQSKQRMQAQLDQNLKLKQQIDQLQKQIKTAKDKINKLELQSNETKNFRANQKQRITEMLMKQKQDAYNKYAEIQSESMKLMQFIQKIQDIIQKKLPEDKQDEPGRIKYIKEIQLEASKFYSILTHPIAQQLLNAITQTINSLNKKFQRMQKSDKNGNSRNSTTNIIKPLLKLKSSEKQKISKGQGTYSFELAMLKEQFARMTEKYTESLKQTQNSLEFEKEKCLNMKKKIEKLEGEIQFRNKEIDIIRQKQEDTTKKIKWLEQQLLDNERKLKMQNQQIELYQKGGNSMQNIDHKQYQTQTRTKSKSVFNINVGQIQLGNQNTLNVKNKDKDKDKQDIQKMKKQIHQLNNILREKYGQMDKKNKQISQLRARLMEQHNNNQRTKEEYKILKIQLNEQKQKEQLLGKQIQSWKVNNQEKQKSMIKLKQEVEKITVKLNEQQQQIMKKQEQLKQKLQQFQHKLIENELETSKLKDVQQKLTAYQKQVNEKQNEIDMLTQHKKQYESKIVQIQSLLSIEQQLKTKQIYQMNKLKQSNQLLLQQLDSKSQNEKNMKVHYDTLLMDLNNKNAIIQSVSKTISHQQQQINKLTTELNLIKQKTNHIQQLQMQNKQLKQKYIDKNSDSMGKQIKYNQLIEKLSNLTFENANKNEELNTMKNELNKLNTLLIQKDKLSCQLQAEKEDHKRIMQQKQNRIKVLQQSLIQLQRKKIQYLQVIKQHQQQNIKIKAMMEELQKERKNQTVELKRTQLLQNTNNGQTVIKQIEKQNVSHSQSYQEGDIQIEHLSHSKQLISMHNQIIGFKEQLNSLLKSIQLKDQQIANLRAQLGKLKNMHNHEQQQLVRNNSLEVSQTNSLQKQPKQDIHKATEMENQQINYMDKSIELLHVEPSKQLQKLLNYERHIQQLSKIIKQQQSELDKRNIELTKHNILTKKIVQLEQRLEKQKDTYQVQLLKSNLKIFDLEDRLRKLVQQSKQSPVKKRKISSSQYFSFEPTTSNKAWSKQGKSQEKESSKKNAKNLKMNKKNSTQENQDQIYHSFEQECINNQQIQKEEHVRTQQPTKVGLRREKSHQYERHPPTTLRVHKMSSIQKCYHDSDEKSKDDKDGKRIINPTPLPKGVSPSIDKVQKNQDLKSSIANRLSREHYRHMMISNQELPHATYSSNSAMNNENLMKSISQQNKHLKNLNEKLTRDIFHLSLFFSHFEQRWKNLKFNDSQANRLIPIQKIQDNIKFINNEKLQLLEEFSTHNLQNYYDNVQKVVNETKKWVDVIETLSKQNKRMTLEMILSKNYPKLVKTKTSKINDWDETIHRRQRDVYSQGNVIKERNMIDDFSPFQIHQQLHNNINLHHPNHYIHPNPINSLQMLFKQNNEMSEISSVKHNSYNSGFVNSRSEIAKMFEKHQKDQKEKEIKKQENKKDIVDEYMIMNLNTKGQKSKAGDKPKNNQINNQNINKQMNSNTKINKNNNSQPNPKIIQSRIQMALSHNSPNMIKNSSGIYLEANNATAMKKFEEKSTKSKKKVMSKTISRLSSINTKLSEDRRNFVGITQSIVKKYDQKISQMQTKFNETLSKIIKNSITTEQSKKLMSNLKQQKQINYSITAQIPNKINVNVGNKTECGAHSRISEKDQQVQQKIEQMETIIQSQKKELQSKNKSVMELKQQLKQVERKLKEQKSNQQLLKVQYSCQVANSTQLKSSIHRLNQQFKSFIQKTIQNQNQLISKNAVKQDQSIKPKSKDNLTNRKQEQNASRKMKPSQMPPKLPLKKMFSKKSIEQLIDASPCLPKQQTKQQLKKSQNKQETIRNKENNQQIEIEQKSPLMKQDKIVQQQIQLKKQNEQQGVNNKQDLSKKQQNISKSPVGRQDNNKLSQQQNLNNLAKQQQLQQSQKGTQLRLSKVKSSSPTKKQEKQRSSDKVGSDSGKPLNISDLLSNFLNPSANIVKKQVALELTQKQKIQHYQEKIKKINARLSQIIQSHFRKTVIIQPQTLADSPQKIIKSMLQNDRKSKQSQELSENEKQKDKDKSSKTGKDEEQIQHNLNLIQNDLIQLKQQTIKRANQKQDRLKQIMKEIIVAFKISKRSIDKIIQNKERKENNSPKYLNARAFFKNLYDKITKKNSRAVPKNDNIASLQNFMGQNQNIQNDVIRQSIIKDNQDILKQFQSYEDKQNDIMKQNTKLKAQLQNKLDQIQKLKKQIVAQSQINKKQQFRHSYHSMNQSDEKFQDFEHKELYDNTKPSIQLIQELKKQMEFYKNKCKEYEDDQNRRKNQKVKYIRKW